MKNHKPIHPSSLLREVPYNGLKNIRITFINMPLRETSPPTVPPEGPGILSSIVRKYGGEPYIIDLNGYRIKEKMPNNIGEFRVPLGKVEVTKEGNDITLVTYGSTWRIVMEASDQLEKSGISCEVIDIQTLLPFDLNHKIVDSLKKTSRLLIIDEDVPGGASSYILQKVIEEQKGYNFLDSEPQTLTAKEHRPPYGKDGDYFSKPSSEDVFEKVYALINEVNPSKFPSLY